jgi:hypothetical protein
MALPVKFSLLLRLLPLAALLTTGCNAGISQPARVQETLAHCGQSVSGAHYTVCGHWSTLGQAETTQGALTVTGAIDSAPQTTGTRYAVQGGTFHASN